MQKHTRSLLEELSSMPLKRDKEEVVESRASHILEQGCCKDQREPRHQK